MVILQLEEQPPLVQAIIAGELEEVRTLLAQNKHDINYLDIEKRSPLHAAAFKGDPNITELLLQHGARVNCKDNKWLTPLHRACCTGSEETVSVLLRYQADTAARDRQWQTPLHIAAANNAYECMSQLLEVVPNINVTDRSGRTALHHAAMNGHNEVVELLISKGCIINACDKKDCRPIHVAAYMGHVETLELLIRHGADMNAKDRNQYTALHVAAASGMATACRLLLNHGALVESRNSYGNSALHIACLNGHLQVCQELIAFNADPDSTNYRGQTPLHIAAASTHGVDCLNYLLEQNVNINKQSLDGRTPLHMTAIHGRFTRSKTLIDKGAIVDATDKNGCTALHIAAQYGHDLLANTLLSFGADPTKRGCEGRTPLHMCCLSGFVECCRKFVQAGVDLNVQDDTGKTATHCAAYKGSVECLDLLVSNGAKFQLVDNKGRIPLHYAAAQGHYPCVFTLVGLGSSVNLRDAEGCSALHLAAAYDEEGRCVQYLLEHKADPKLKDNQGFTAVHYAVAGNNYKALGYLLAAVGNNYVLHGPDMPLTTPLHLAAANGNLDILSLILPYFHDTNVRTEHGSTPLLLAAREGHTHCVQMLLRFGAKVSICDNVYNMSPVHYSAKNNHMHCLALLLDNTEDKSVINLLDSLQRTALMLAVSGGHTECALILLKSGADPNVVDADKRSCLFRAVVNGQSNAVQLLLSKGADVNKADVNGKTALHLAAACGNLPCLKTVLTYMEHDVIIGLDKQNCSALHWACYNGNFNCVDFLLSNKIFETLKGNQFSPMHCAAFAGSEKCIELLYKYYGAELVNIKDARNRTPLHIAALHGHAECAKYLLEKGAEVNCQDAEGRTPLIFASQNGQSQVIDVLISYKADTTLYDSSGNTALHLACLRKHTHAALLLLEHINDENIVNMINNERKTPLHLAARNGLVEVTRQLISKGSSVLAVDASGMTPALCCAPNNSVAQCLAVILSSYPKQQQASIDGNFANKESSQHQISASPSEDSYLIRHVIQVKSSPKNCKDQETQTKMSLLRNPDYFECRLMCMEGKTEQPKSNTMPASHSTIVNNKNKNLIGKQSRRKLSDKEINDKKMRANSEPFLLEQHTLDRKDDLKPLINERRVNSLDLHRSHSNMMVNKGTKVKHPKRDIEELMSAFSRPEQLKSLLMGLNLGENKPNSFYEKLSEKLTNGTAEIDKCLKQVLLKSLAEKWAKDTSANFLAKYVNRKTSDETLDKIIKLRSKIAALRTTNEVIGKLSKAEIGDEFLHKIREQLCMTVSELSIKKSDSQTEMKNIRENINPESEHKHSEEDVSALVIKYHTKEDSPTVSAYNINNPHPKRENSTELNLTSACNEKIKTCNSEESVINLINKIAASQASTNQEPNDSVLIPRKLLEKLIKPNNTRNFMIYKQNEEKSNISLLLNHLSDPDIAASRECQLNKRSNPVCLEHLVHNCVKTNKSDSNIVDFYKRKSPTGSLAGLSQKSSYTTKAMCKFPGCYHHSSCSDVEDDFSRTSTSSYLKVLESFSSDEILKVDDIYKMDESITSKSCGKKETKLPLKGRKPSTCTSLIQNTSNKETLCSIEESSYRDTIKQNLLEVKDAECLKSIADYVTQVVTSYKSSRKWMPRFAEHMKKVISIGCSATKCEECAQTTSLINLSPCHFSPIYISSTTNIRAIASEIPKSEKQKVQHWYPTEYKTMRDCGVPTESMLSLELIASYKDEITADSTPYSSALSEKDKESSSNSSSESKSTSVNTLDSSNETISKVTIVPKEESLLEVVYSKQSMKSKYQRKLSDSDAKEARTSGSNLLNNESDTLEEVSEIDSCKMQKSNSYPGISDTSTIKEKKILLVRQEEDNVKQKNKDLEPVNKSSKSEMVLRIGTIENIEVPVDIECHTSVESIQMNKDSKTREYSVSEKGDEQLEEKRVMDAISRNDAKIKKNAKVRNLKGSTNVTRRKEKLSKNVDLENRLQRSKKLDRKVILGLNQNLKKAESEMKNIKSMRLKSIKHNRSGVLCLEENVEEMEKENSIERRIRKDKKLQRQKQNFGRFCIKKKAKTKGGKKEVRKHSVKNGNVVIKQENTEREISKMYQDYLKKHSQSDDIKKEDSKSSNTSNSTSTSNKCESTKTTPQSTDKHSSRSSHSPDHSSKKKPRSNCVIS